MPLRTTNLAPRHRILDRCYLFQASVARTRGACFLQPVTSCAARATQRSQAEDVDRTTPEGPVSQQQVSDAGARPKALRFLKRVTATLAVTLLVSGPALAANTASFQLSNVTSSIAGLLEAFRSSFMATFAAAARELTALFGQQQQVSLPTLIQSISGQILFSLVLALFCLGILWAAAASAPKPAPALATAGTAYSAIPPAGAGFMTAAPPTPSRGSSGPSAARADKPSAAAPGSEALAASTDPVWPARPVSSSGVLPSQARLNEAITAANQPDAASPLERAYAPDEEARRRELAADFERVRATRKAVDASAMVTDFNFDVTGEAASRADSKPSLNGRLTGNFSQPAAFKPMAGSLESVTESVSGSVSGSVDKPAALKPMVGSLESVNESMVGSVGGSVDKAEAATTTDLGKPPRVAANALRAAASSGSSASAPVVTAMAFFLAAKDAYAPTAAGKRALSASKQEKVWSRLLGPVPAQYGTSSAAEARGTERVRGIDAVADVAAAAATPFMPLLSRSRQASGTTASSADSAAGAKSELRTFMQQPRSRPAWDPLANINKVAAPRSRSSWDPISYVVDAQAPTRARGPAMSQRWDPLAAVHKVQAPTRDNTAAAPLDPLANLHMASAPTYASGASPRWDPLTAMLCANAPQSQSALDPLRALSRARAPSSATSKFDPVAALSRASAPSSKARWDPVAALSGAEAPNGRSSWDPMAALAGAEAPRGTSNFDPVAVLAKAGPPRLNANWDPLRKLGELQVPKASARWDPRVSLASLVRWLKERPPPSSGKPDNLKALAKRLDWDGPEAKQPADAQPKGDSQVVNPVVDARAPLLALEREIVESERPVRSADKGRYSGVRKTVSTTTTAVPVDPPASSSEGTRAWRVRMVAKAETQPEPTSHKVNVTEVDVDAVMVEDPEKKDKDGRPSGIRRT